MSINEPDKEYWEAFFTENKSNTHYLSNSDNEFILNYENEISPFYMGGYERGFIHRSALDMLISSCEERKTDQKHIRILEVGSGFGDLSVYLSLKGFDVIGLDIAEASMVAGQKLASKFNANCSFIATSIEKTPFPANYFDFVIGFASFHHFIKYKAGANELHRIMKPGASGFFSDPFHENPLYNLFHNKKEMEKFGDELMTRKKIYTYFSNFKVSIIPIDWFVMFDKFFLYIAGNNRNKYIKHLRKISRYFFFLDRKIPKNSSASLFFSGGIVTKITKNNRTF